MCTLVILRRPGHAWPVIIAANRDEMIDRPWREPDRHWPDRPEVVGGLDELAGGSWLAVNEHGVAAGILNRIGSPGPPPGRRTPAGPDNLRHRERLGHGVERAHRPTRLRPAWHPPALPLRRAATGPIAVAGDQGLTPAHSFGANIVSAPSPCYTRRGRILTRPAPPA